MTKPILYPCPFCGAVPSGIKLQTHKGGSPRGYVLKISHNTCCFIEQLSDAYYAEKSSCVTEWNRRFEDGPMDQTI